MADLNHYKLFWNSIISLKKICLIAIVLHAFLFPSHVFGDQLPVNPQLNEVVPQNMPNVPNAHGPTAIHNTLMVKKEKGLVDLGFIHAFVASLSVIIVSELGDKTFFIAAIMAMRHPRITIFMAAMGALGLMTVLSALLGYATTVIPRWLTYYVSSALFAIFGVKMLKEGIKMSPDEGQEEYEEVQAELRQKEEEAEKESAGLKDIETGIIRGPPRHFWSPFFSRIFMQALTLTFLAEWGDRSQIATIILAAREEVIGVILGGVLGHALCTGLAVLGGRFIAQKISARTVHLAGGIVFLIFAVSAFFIEPDD